MGVAACGFAEQVRQSRKSLIREAASGRYDASMEAKLVALVRDLLFASRISATAQSMGVSLKMLRDPEKLAGELADRVIVDLNQPGALEAASSWKAATGAEVVGFVSHVDQETIHRARLAGINVMPRSQFGERLVDLLRTPAS